MFNLRNKNSGFTLIELMVATSIFMMVILAAIGALMITSNASKQSKTLRYAMDNVNFAMDAMTRNIRLGSDMACLSISPIPAVNGSFPSVPLGDHDCYLLPTNGIIFSKPNSSAGSYDIAYQLALDSSSGHNVIEKCDGSTGVCMPITAPEVDITNLKFMVYGSDLNDYIQPSVTILVQGNVTIGDKTTTFTLQTLASQRTFEQ